VYTKTEVGNNVFLLFNTIRIIGWYIILYLTYYVRNLLKYIVDQLRDNYVRSHLPTSTYQQPTWNV